MSDTSVSRIIDGHLCEETAVETGVTLESPVSHMVFAIYLAECLGKLSKRGKCK